MSLHTLSKFFTYAALFSIVVVMSTTFFPFIGGKYFFFRLTTEAALACFVLFWGFQDKKGEAERLVKAVIHRPLFLAVSLFVAVGLLASFFAYDPHGAFWSNYERGEGAFQMLHYYLFFFLLSVLFTTWKDWRRAMWLSVGAALLMVLYGSLGYLHLYNCHPLKFPEGVPPACSQSFSAGIITPYQGSSPQGIPTGIWDIFSVNRFQGTLGNPAYVAPYLLFSMFYAAFLWSTSEKRNHHAKKDIRSLVVKAISFSLLILAFLLFFTFSQTRGGFLGLIVGLVVFFVALLFSWPAARKWVLGVGVLFFLLLGLTFFYQENPVIQKLPFKRIFEINLSDQTAQTRLWTWNSAWQGIKERPLLGWGQENVSTVFDKYFDPRHFIPGKNTETWFDRAHSVAFDYLATIGFIGFLSYLAVLGLYVWQIIKMFFGLEKKERLSFLPPAAWGLLLAILTGYFVQGLILFDVLPIYINLFLMLAFVGWLYHEFSSNKNPGIVSGEKK